MLYKKLYSTVDRQKVMELNLNTVTLCDGERLPVTS